jgi:superfamily I DNA and/or RNA helicase
MFKYLNLFIFQHYQITILCTYADQFFDIRQRLDQSFGGDRSHGIRVANVDNYQGEECDIIILSLVRSNNPQNRIGFLNVS